VKEREGGPTSCESWGTSTVVWVDIQRGIAADARCTRNVSSFQTPLDLDFVPEEVWERHTCWEAW
jgi:hypothetical protein